MRRFGVWAAVPLLFVLACGSHSTMPKQGQAPDFELLDLQGRKVQLSGLKGHPLLVDFWATWCGPCQMSIPLLQSFYERHKDEGLIVLGLNMDEDAELVPEFIKRFKMTYPVLLAGQSAVASDFGVSGLPSFFFIDPNGAVVQSYEGFREDIADSWETTFQSIKATSSHS